MKRIVLEVDGVRHSLVKNAKLFDDYCEKEKCSLYSFCQRSPGAPCVIIAPTGYHFEQAPSDSPRGGTEGDNREIKEKTPSGSPSMGRGGDKGEIIRR